ncbi:hypothetical protein FHT15_002258 [Xanthomonas campestris]
MKLPTVLACRREWITRLEYTASQLQPRTALPRDAGTLFSWAMALHLMPACVRDAMR